MTRGECNTLCLLLATWLSASIAAAPARDNAGLIVKAVDTLYYNSQLGHGMDFVLARPCTTVDEPGCVQHVGGGYVSYPDICYQTFVSGTGGRFKRMGKVNLDAISQAPPDSEMVEDAGDGLRVFMCPPPDSLAQYIGNVYVIKTGNDPRDGVRVRAKLKILDFRIRDFQEHQIDLIFLWVANLSGRDDLTSSNLDTFTLDYHVDTIGSTLTQGEPPRAAPRFGGARAWRVVVGEDGVVRVPGELGVGGNVLALYDIRGRAIGNLPTVDASTPRRLVRGRGLLLLRSRR